MCGIAGGIGRIGDAQAEAVKAALRHRGPDDAGTYIRDDAWLLNTRLAIQDLSPAGHQPMQSPDGRYTLVFNGEIYNHKTLRKGLGKDRFLGDSDTETLLHCWARSGAACLNELDGDFAIAVYDSQRQELTIARDRMGVKPLYWYFDGQRFAFASELKALLVLPEIDRSLDTSVFANYLLYQYNPDDRTPFAHIRKLPPSQLLRIGTDTLNPELERWYSLPYGTGDDEHHSRDGWIEETRRRLEHAVRAQLLSDAPLALTLSGGLDSALVAALARKARPDASFTAYCIDTRGGMAAEGFAEDAAYAKIAASHLGIALRLIPGDYDLGAEIDAMVYALDEPQADPAAINIRLIAKAAKADGNSVLLSGTGADDLFSGYRRHQLLRFQRVLSAVPGAIRSLAPLAGSFAATYPSARRIEKALRTAGRPQLQAAIHSFFWAEPATLSGLFRESIASLEHPYSLFEQRLQEIPGENAALNKLLFLEQRSFLPQHNLAYMDKLSMAEGVEMRVPFADRHLVALAAALPLELKMRGAETKVVLRRIARDLLPAAVIDRPKTGFAFPLRSWARGAGKTLIRERLLQSGFLDRGIFDASAVGKFVEETLAGRRDGAYTLFSLLCIESWLRQFSARS